MATTDRTGCAGERQLTGYAEEGAAMLAGVFVAAHCDAFERWLGERGCDPRPYLEWVRVRAAEPAQVAGPPSA